MNVFILSTGRCGTMTFSKACRHIENYTSGHETRLKLIGHARLHYPDNHIEVDNRLSWLLGRLDRVYGDTAFYVHLSRDKQQVATSYARRFDFGLMKAYKDGILLEGHDDQSNMDIALDCIETIETNIELFLQNKTHKMHMSLENAQQEFEIFWQRIGAIGDLGQALAEWDINYNASGEAGNN